MENKKICQVCDKELTENDDVVVCPVCGAPHHRNCYISFGHCGKEQYHGTENQYKADENEIEQPPLNEVDAENENVIGTEATPPKPKRIRCGSCGKEIDNPDAQFCPYCGKRFIKIVNPDGTPYGEDGDNGGNSGSPFFQIPFGGATMPDPLGGVPKDAKIGNVTATDAAKFVALGTQRYIPKFFGMITGNKASWNWAAFLFPTAWCFFRKLYKDGIIFLILKLLGTLLWVPAYSAVLSSLAGQDTSAMSNQQLLDFMLSHSDSITAISAGLYLLGLGIMIGIRVFAGIRADWMYRGHVISKVTEINSNNELLDDEINYEYLKKGSVNFIAGLIGFAAESYLFMIVMSFFS